METALCILYSIAGILMILATLFVLADAAMTLNVKRRKKALLDKLDAVAEMLDEAVAADLAEAEKHFVIMPKNDLMEKILTVRDFEDDGK